MSQVRFYALVCSVGLTVAGASVAYGQAYPSKPIRIFTSTVGSGIDLAARIMAPELTSSLGQPIIVENRPASLIADNVARAAPDGYTLAFGGSAVWIQPLLQKVSYDVVKDFAPVIWVSSTPLCLIIHPSLPVKSVKELIALAKARPGQLSYAAGSVGGGGHLAGLLLKNMGNINILMVPYKGAAESNTSVMSGETQATINNVGDSMVLAKTGRVKALAVTSLEPSPLAPGIPTIAATGLPGFEWVTILGILAPTGTPTAIVNRLNQEFGRVMNRPDTKERLRTAGGVEIVGGTSEQFDAKIKSEIAKWGKVIKDAGIKIE